MIKFTEKHKGNMAAYTEAVFRRVLVLRIKDRHAACSITNDMPSGSVGEVRSNDAPEASDDDDDGGDDDGEPARSRQHSKPSKYPSALLPFTHLSHYVGFGRSRIYAEIKSGKFPPPIKFGKSSRWVKAEIDAWISQQVAARNSLSAG